MRILSELYPHWFVTNNISAASASASHLFLSLSRLNAPAVINCCDDERPTAERERVDAADARTDTWRDNLPPE